MKRMLFWFPWITGSIFLTWLVWSYAFAVALEAPEFPVASFILTWLVGPVFLAVCIALGVRIWKDIRKGRLQL